MSASRRQDGQQETRRREEAALWRRFAPARREGEHDLENPETLNALAAFAEGHADDPGRDRIERRLLHSDAALEDLAFLRWMQASDAPPLPDGIIERAEELIRDGAPAGAAAKRLSGRFWETGARAVFGRAWIPAMSAAGLLLFSLAGFQLGMGVRQSQLTIDRLLVAELPVALADHPGAGLDDPWGGR